MAKKKCPRGFKQACVPNVRPVRVVETAMTAPASPTMTRSEYEDSMYERDSFDGLGSSEPSEADGWSYGWDAAFGYNWQRWVTSGPWAGNFEHRSGSLTWFTKHSNAPRHELDELAKAASSSKRLVAHYGRNESLENEDWSF